MFLLTNETCRRFTFAEILIMAAMNVESARLDAAGQVAPKNVTAEKR